MKKTAKKLKSSQGFTLIELLVTILILVILIGAMSTGMETAIRIYHESTFLSNSASMSAMLNSTFEDFLRYSTDIYTRSGTGFVGSGDPIPGDSIPASVQYLFTNVDYGAQHAYIYTVTPDSDQVAPVRIKNAAGSTENNFLNAGAFPDMTVKDLVIEQVQGGKLYHISYTVVSDYRADLTREEDFYVRPLNN